MSKNNKIGILDPLGKFPNPITNKPYSQEYLDLSSKWKEFPAYEQAEFIIQDIYNNQVILVISGTGSGKTVLLPKFVLHTTDYKGHIAVTLPKQIIAKSAAEFAAKTLDVQLGKEVGYKYKGSPKEFTGDNPNLLYATDGTIVAKLLDDPLLKSYDAVIIDEAHERKIQIDFLLYLLKNVIINRPEFKLIIMSATIDSSIFKSYFAEVKFKTIDIGGKTNFPIESIFTTEYSSNAPNNYINLGKTIIENLMNKYDKITDTKTKINDILFFVTSINETIEVANDLKKIYPDIQVISVYSGISNETQDELQNKKKNDRRIIISTNVAESSLTVDGIKYVIDSGYELFSYDDPITGGKVLKKQLISLAQAKQRMGRAGRTQPGICYHLYTKDEFDNKMIKFPLPSIRTTDITTESIQLMMTKDIKTIKSLLDILSKFIEPPRENYIKKAILNMIDYKILKNCVAEKLGDCELNELGLLVGELNMSLEFAISSIIAYKLRCFKEVYMILNAQEIIKNNFSELFMQPNIKTNRDLLDKFNKAKDGISSSLGDHITILYILETYDELKSDQEKLKNWAFKNFIKLNTIHKINDNFKRTYYRILDILKNNKDIINDIYKLQIDDKTLMDGEEYKLKNRIITALMMGYKTHSANKTNGNYYVDNLKVSISRDSTLYDTTHRNIWFTELFIMDDKYNMKIVSLIPTKSKELSEYFI
jgi:pre-mRNA-splicing factor ATP-dependent RNA helicase DHX15/PRP43